MRLFTSARTRIAVFLAGGIVMVLAGVMAGRIEHHLTVDTRSAPQSGAGAGAGAGGAEESAPPFRWDLPDWAPRPPVPDDNPMSAEKVELGRFLFYDTRLSATGEIACATCHLQERAFADGRTTPIGATGERHPRNAMSLANVGYAPVLTWANPLLTRLEDQALIPMFGEHPVEMGLSGREEALLAMLRADPDYPRRFAAAFPDQADPIGIGALVRALAAFQRTLISFDSPYDRYRYGRDPTAISESARRGEALFFSERLECFHCHGGLTFSDSVTHERLPFPEIAFHNTGLYNIDRQGGYPAPNTGVHEISHRPHDMGRFRAPSLRNVELTAPYMHDGSIATLDEVLDHYEAGGRTIAEGPHAGIGRDNPYRSGFVIGFALTGEERADLLAFLRSLTDRGFVTALRFGNPFAARGPADVSPAAAPER